MEKRRASIIKTIEQQGQLTPELQAQLNSVSNLQSLEDIYLPYKQKRKTRAAAAIEKGLEPLAKIIFAQNGGNFDNKTEEELSGARDIIAEWVNENVSVRNTIRKTFEREAILYAKVKKGKEADAIKYRDYFFFKEELRKIPSHRLLAIKRGQEEGFLKAYVAINNEPAVESINRLLVKGNGASQKQVVLAIADAYERLLVPSMETEFENLSKEKADKEAINIFTTNLRQLLLSAPLGQKRILAIDPGFRTGCKTVVLNEVGDLQEETVLYPLQKQFETQQSLKHLLSAHKVEAVAIGNGTGGRETETFVRDFIKNNPEFKAIQIHMVSEQGASIYSASEIAREEFPDKDITVRGAVSIGRRLKDPLAELVKIDPKSIGVGQYQHDVNQKQLKESLFHLSAESMQHGVTIAYEPIWAIGTGKIPTLSEIEEIHASIRELLHEYMDEEHANLVRIVYGGSCNATNAKSIFALPNVDGGLVGGASLQLDSIKEIIASI